MKNHGWLTLCLVAVSTLAFVDTPMSHAQPAKDPAVEASVQAGLRWLALHQSPDGGWRLHAFPSSAWKDLPPKGQPFRCDCETDTTRRNDTAATAFAVLPFLAAGYTHKSRNMKPNYTKTVQAGVSFLIENQDRTGFLGGDIYAHGLATIALCEAYGLTRDPPLKRSAQAAVNYILKGQHLEGGWRYTVGSSGDLSVTGWQVQALTSAKNAGFPIPKAALAGAEKFVLSCRKEDGGFSYLPSSKSTYSMTAVGLLALQHLTGKDNVPQLAKGLEKFGANVRPGKSKNRYYEYYALQVMYRVGDKTWDEWKLGIDKNGDGMKDLLLKAQFQDPDGRKPHQKGSWGKEGRSTANDGGRIMATSLALLMLQLERGQLSLFKKKAAMGD